MAKNPKLPATDDPRLDKANVLLLCVLLDSLNADLAGVCRDIRKTIKKCAELDARVGKAVPQTAKPELLPIEMKMTRH